MFVISFVLFLVTPLYNPFMVYLIKVTEFSCPLINPPPLRTREGILSFSCSFLLLLGTIERATDAAERVRR